MTLSGYVPVLRRWWHVILLATLVSTVAGYAITSRMEPTYESSTRALVGPISEATLDDLRVSGQLAQTYAELATSEVLLAATIRDVPLSITVPELRRAVRARGDAPTRLLTITVAMRDPALAAATANQITIALSQTASARPNTPGAVQVVSPATPATRPVAPQVLLSVALASAAGLVGALMIVLFADYFIDRVRGRAELEGLTDAPVLGVTPLAARPPESLSRLALDAQTGPDAATYRRLAALIFPSAPDGPRTLVVAGTDNSDRSAELALHLAFGAATAGRQVTVIDVDDTARGVTRLLGPEDAAAVPGHAGLRRPVARGPVEIRPYPGMPFSEQPEQDVRRALRSLAQEGRIVIVSAGSLAASPMAATWAGACDSIALVILRDSTRRRAVMEAVNHVRLLGTRYAGVIFAEPGRAPRSPRRPRRRGRVEASVTRDSAPTC